MKDNLPVYVVSNTCINDEDRDYIESGINAFFIKSSSMLDEIIGEAKNYALV